MALQLADDVGCWHLRDLLADDVGVGFAGHHKDLIVGDEGRELATKLADYLKGTTYFISVIGHTDNQQPMGNLAQKYPTNWELAAARAANAVKYLQSQGVEPDRMIAVSKGEFDPVASNSTADGRSQNRRIEVVLRTLPGTGD